MIQANKTQKEKLLPSTETAHNKATSRIKVDFIIGEVKSTVIQAKLGLGDFSVNNRCFFLPTTLTSGSL
jgi:hypothetical protein